MTREFYDEEATQPQDVVMKTATRTRSTPTLPHLMQELPPGTIPLHEIPTRYISDPPTPEHSAWSEVQSNLLAVREELRQTHPLHFVKKIFLKRRIKQLEAEEHRRFAQFTGDTEE